MLSGYAMNMSSTTMSAVRLIFDFIIMIVSVVFPKVSLVPEVLTFPKRTTFGSTVKAVIPAFAATTFVTALTLAMILTVSVVSSERSFLALFLLQIMTMECERPDVAFLILFCLFQALFELTVLLETVFLGHLALLLFALHDATVLTEILQFSVEHLVFTELTLQRSVIERNLDTWLQTDLVEAFFTVTEHPGIVAFELVLQSFTYHFIGTQEVGRGDAFAIGRIGDHDTLVGRLREILEVLLLNGNDVTQSGGLHILQCRIHGFDVNVVAIDMVFELAFLALVVIDIVEEVGIEVRPFLKSPGAMFLANRAASMRMVPEPHMGSIKSVSPFQPERRIIPAASTSLRGASTLSCR